MTDTDTARIYREGAFGGRQGAGRRPCLLVIDFSRGFTDPASPLYCRADAAVESTAQLIDRARAVGTPIVYTTVAYDEAGLRAAQVFLAKIPALAELTADGPWGEIDARIAPQTHEPVLVKLWASAFFGTPLASMLVAYGCDTVVIVGASTSGCVRASAVDALQHGYRVIVPRQAVADRAGGAHDAALLDIDAKYGDVVELDDALDALAPD